MSDWIEYYKDRKQEMPTSGFVEFVNTFDPDKRTFMDMSVNSIERSIIWNRAAPSCVNKYRFVSETEFLNVKLAHLKSQIDKLTKEVETTTSAINASEKRIKELQDDENE